MKATIDIPDDLYRRTKAKAALQGRAVRDVTIELFQRWVGTQEDAPMDSVESNKRWVEEFLASAVPADTPGPCAREILEADRKRLEPRE